MFFGTENKRNDPRGYSLIEMLIVTAIITILATIPIALLRRSREKTYEAAALKSLRMIALAYENYWAQDGHMYPNYVSSGQLSDGIQFKNAEEIWDGMIERSLLPMMYSGTRHDRRDLLARGYIFTIYAADYGTLPGTNPRNTYAFAMIPYDGSTANRGIAMVSGPRFFSEYPGPVPRNMNGMSLYSMHIYRIGD
jgi:prepilin-type N-terminal cleavage/methylation domain-containing protein